MYFTSQFRHKIPLSDSNRYGFGGIARSVVSRFLPPSSCQQRVQNILAIANSTLSGREAVASAAATNASIILDPSLHSKSADISGAPSTIRLCPHDADELLANLGVHEMDHNLQNISIQKNLGRHDAFECTGASIGDLVYPNLIKEGVAFTRQIINAYELFQLGKKEPWTWLHFTYHLRPLTDALSKMTLAGIDVHSDLTKQTIFETWMKESPFRWGYEAQHLLYLAAHFGQLRHTTLASTTCPTICGALRKIPKADHIWTELI